MPRKLSFSRRPARLPACLQSANVRRARGNRSDSRSRPEARQDLALDAADPDAPLKRSPLLVLSQAVGLTSAPRRCEEPWDWESGDPQVLSEDNGNLSARKPLRCEGSGSIVIIFDWDDTLCPTTFLQGMRLCDGPRRPKPASLQTLLESHARLVEAVLREAAAIARVSIVTLAKRAWLRECQAFHLPGLNLSNLLAELGVTIYYAQDDNARRPAEQRCSDWASLKQAAMERSIRDLGAKDARGAGSPGISWNSIISVGDGPWERQALRGLLGIDAGNCVSDATPSQKAWSPPVNGRPWCKTVKLMVGPSLEDLGQELCSLPPLLRDVALRDEDLDFCADSPSELAAGAYVSV